MAYVRICESINPRRNCGWVDETELLAGGSNTLDDLFSGQIISEQEFYAYLLMVATFWTISFIIRQMLNQIQWKR